MSDSKDPPPREPQKPSNMNMAMYFVLILSGFGIAALLIVYFSVLSMKGICQ